MPSKPRVGLDDELDKVGVTVPLEWTVYQQLRKHAERQGKSMADIMRKALFEYLGRVK